MRPVRLILCAAVCAAPLAAWSATEAGKLRDRLGAAAAPYLGKAQGWDTGGEVKAKDGPDGATILTIPALVYRGPEGAADFGATVLEIKAAAGGYAVVAKPARLRLSDAQGRAADLDFADGRLQGVWDPARAALRDLAFSLRDLRGTTGDGGKVIADAVSGSFTGQPDAFGGETTVKALELKAADGRFSTLDRVVLGLRLAPLEQSPRLSLDYRHERAPAAAGLQRELIPTRLTVAARVDRFPWREALRRLPGTIAALARGGGVGTAAEALLQRAGAVLTVESLSARTPTLTASGKGEARYQDGRPVGQLTVDVGGLDDRLGSLPVAEQRRSPTLYPGLAVITLLGEAQGRGKGMARRYRLELLPNGGIGLNGKNLSALALPLSP